MSISCQVPSHSCRHGIIGLAAAAMVCLQACAGAINESGTSRRATDIWDISLLLVQHIDLQAEAFGASSFNVTGFISAVVADGDRLYITDSGSRRVLEFNMATRDVRTIGGLRDASTPGLIVGNDGRVYALDPVSRAVQVMDPFSGQRETVSLTGSVAMPIDLALIDGYDLAVLDALEGRVVFLDVPGGAFMDRPLRRTNHPFVASGRAMASSAGVIFVLDDRADDVAGFDANATPIGLFANDELFDASAMAADSCGRFFVSDGEDGTLYVGIPEMSVPGIRVPADELHGKEIADLWADDVFLYVATRAGGIFIYLVDPGCD